MNDEQTMIVTLTTLLVSSAIPRDRILSDVEARNIATNSFRVATFLVNAGLEVPKGEDA